jgi:hypothetical protein
MGTGGTKCKGQRPPRYNQEVQTVPEVERRPRLSGAIGLTLGLYTLVLLVGPALHHDVACHLKSRTHCTTCVVSVSASGTPAASGLLVAALPEREALVFETPDLAPGPAITSRFGRSPPA